MIIIISNEMSYRIMVLHFKHNDENISTPDLLHVRTIRNISLCFFRYLLIRATAQPLIVAEWLQCNTSTTNLEALAEVRILVSVMDLTMLNL